MQRRYKKDMANIQQTRTHKGSTLVGAPPVVFVAVYSPHELVRYICLVGGLEHFLFFHVFGMSTSQLTFIFSGG